MSKEDAWEWFWSLFKSDFSKNDIIATDLGIVHTFLLEKYKRDPTVLKKYISTYEASTGLIISLDGNIHHALNLLEGLETTSEEGQQIYKNTICINITE